MDVQHQARLVGELLQLDFPEPHARTVRAAAVGRYRQLARLRIALPSHSLEPAADRLHGKLGRVGRNADTDDGGVGRHVVDAVRHHLAQRLVLEVASHLGDQDRLQ